MFDCGFVVVSPEVGPRLAVHRHDDVEVESQCDELGPRPLGVLDVDELIAELKALRKGRGLDAPDIVARIGPALHAAFSLEADDDPADVRARLISEMKALVSSLPTDLADAVSTAFGLVEGTRTRLYGDRVKLLAQRMRRDERTAIRRIDDGIRVMAESAAGRKHKQREEMPGGTPWRTTALRTSVVLDREVAEIYEMRRIAATVEGLREVRLELSIPVPSNWQGAEPPNDPEIIVLHGGTLRTRLNYSSTRVVFDLELPFPLELGAEHEFFVCFRFAGKRQMGPFYMCTPSFPCELFDLHVRFGIGRLPSAIWKVDGLRMSEVNDHAAPREPISADAAGEVSMVFRGLTPNLSFGIAWDE
ncbi:hypothetical protein Lesp02_13370 [Lentzea sp. NBRC 105346]|nr:hypothetical protein Lesp02_13370 [Lentzea sp. NBRC 105346]